MYNLFLHPGRARRSLNRGCCGCVFVVVIILAILVLSLGFGVALGVRSARASPSFESNAVLLAPAVPEAPPADQARGVFLQRTLTVTVTATRVRLASTPDGTGNLCADDLATLTFTRADGTTERWTHLFAGPDRRVIACRPPADLSDLLRPDEYRVEVLLEDRYPHTYSARPFYLVFGPEPTPTATTATTPRVEQPTARQRLAVTDAYPSPTTERGEDQAGSPTPTAVRESDAGPAAAVMPDQPASPAGRETPCPTSQPIAGGNRPMLEAGRAVLLRAPNILLPASVVVLGVLAALLLVGLARRRRPRSLPAHPGGIIDLTDQASGARLTALVPGYPQGVAVTRRPLALHPWPSQAPARTVGEVVARIETRAADLLLTGVGEDPAHAASPVVLRPDQTYPLAGGEVTLRYRRP